MVEGFVDGPWWGDCFGEGDSFELGGEGVDLSLEASWGGCISGSGECRRLGSGEDVSVDEALVWGAGLVVAFGDFRADAFS